jgi:hypothetical protein
LDKRAKLEAQDLNAKLGSSLYKHTGIPEVNPAWTACKIAWLKRNQPAVFKNVYKFLLVQDYIVFKLTGNFITEGSISCTTMLYDIVDHRWWPEVLDAIGLEPGRLAEISRPGEKGGDLSRQSAEILGLPEGIPVCLYRLDPNFAFKSCASSLARLSNQTKEGKRGVPDLSTEINVSPWLDTPIPAISLRDTPLALMTSFTTAITAAQYPSASISTRSTAGVASL